MAVDSISSEPWTKEATVAVATATPSLCPILILVVPPEREGGSCKNISTSRSHRRPWLVGVLELWLVGLTAPSPGEAWLFVLLRPGSLFAEVLELGPVVVAGVALALAGGDRSDLDSPKVSIGAGQLDALGATVCRDAAVIQRILPPPFPLANGIRKKVRWEALTRTNQLLDWLDAAAKTVGDIAGGVQFPAAELQRFWKEGKE